MAQFITSSSNPLIKEAINLNQKKYRKLNKLALIEGYKIIKEALNEKKSFNKLFIEESKKEEYSVYVNELDCEVIYTNRRVMETLSPTQTPQGIIAIIETSVLEPIIIPSNFLILDHVQDPGNLGAIIRTAAASGFNNIYMINCVDIYNDKVVRASMGNIFKTKNYNVTLEKLKELLAVKEFNLLAADMDGENIFEINLPKDKLIGIIIGNEGKGISKEVKEIATKTISIPMQNNVESLNAAVSASIIMYNFKD